MSDAVRSFHEQWLGMVQPSEGLVVSIPALVEAQCMEKQPRAVQEALLSCCARDADKRLYVPDLSRLFEQVLALPRGDFDSAAELPRALRLYVPEGQQELKPSFALKRRPAGKPSSDAKQSSAQSSTTQSAAQSSAAQAAHTPASEAGSAYAALIWEVPAEVDLDKPETITGPWEYPAQAKFDRLLRECRVPIGILSNGRELRLTYAPHGESSGWLAFRVDAMSEVGGRPILDALVMLLHRARWFSVAEDMQLPALLASSRGKQGEVTNALAGQLFEALEELLAGFSAASDRDRLNLLRRALEEQEEGYLYAGLLTLLLRLVFTLYCEDRGLLPVESELYQQNYSLFALYDQLEKDNGRFPDSMDRRFGAYPRLVSLFRAMYLGVSHGDLELPPRHGGLFDPNAYPFLEGWGGGSAPIRDAEARSRVDVPAIGDGTIYRVLKQLIVLNGQRLSYRALDVEQIGSVYEALMGFDVERLPSAAVRIKLSSKRHAARVWLSPELLLAVPASRRAKWLQDELNFDKGSAAKIVKALKDIKPPKDDKPNGANSSDAALTALEPLSGRARERAAAGALVIQPGPERRRTSSHYTPRSLTEPIVEQALRPLISAMGKEPSSEALLSLKICDPAMGSGAFLVAACRFLADQVVAAWTREAARETGSLKGIGPKPTGASLTKLELLGDAKDDVVNHARRLVAQRCLYGVDKNKYAVQLARLSLWLVTMARSEPFTFVDHALRHGDSLVGLNFDQIRAFNWRAGHQGEQVEVASIALRQALDEAISIRQQILELAVDGSPKAQREKERLLADSEDAVGRAQLIADLVIGAFFAEAKDKDREAERVRRLDLVQRWLDCDDQAQEQELEAPLREMQQAIRSGQVPFHWHLEFPEVFYQERPDPLDGGKVNGAAMMEAVVGNPPFAGKNGISAMGGPQYLKWLLAQHPGSHGNADYSAHFFRRADLLLGRHGTLALIATNTIGQGDTRSTGLLHLVHGGYGIYRAVRNMPWPGDAAVIVSVVHMSHGNPAKHCPLPVLNSLRVEFINSRLRAGLERADPRTLAATEEYSYQGTTVLGMGFTLTQERRDELIARASKNAARIFPFLGGAEVNSSPTHSHHRFVITFGDLALDEAEGWPDLIDIVRSDVKPERDRAKHSTRPWWQFERPRPELYDALRPLTRCLVNSQVSKHLVFAYQPKDRIFAHTLYAYPLEAYASFATLQSRVHEGWARLLSSSMKTDLRYAPSDCFETFPFPHPDPRSVIPELEAIGEQLYEARAKYMVDTDQGLTKTYNALKDPGCVDERILALRQLHEEMDRAVLRAYPKLKGVGSQDPDVVGWSDIAVPPFCVATDADQAALQAFEDEVIDRLFVLNAQRAKEEAALGRGAKGQKKAGTKQSAGKGGKAGKAPATRAKAAADAQAELDADTAERASGETETDAEATAAAPKKGGRRGPRKAPKKPGKDQGQLF